MYLLCNEIHPNAKFIFILRRVAKVRQTYYSKLRKTCSENNKEISKNKKQLQFSRIEMMQIDLSLYYTTQIITLFYRNTLMKIPYQSQQYQTTLSYVFKSK